MAYMKTSTNGLVNRDNLALFTKFRYYMI